MKDQSALCVSPNQSLIVTFSFTVLLFGICGKTCLRWSVSTGSSLTHPLTSSLCGRLLTSTGKLRLFGTCASMLEYGQCGGKGTKDFVEDSFDDETSTWITFLFSQGAWLRHLSLSLCFLWTLIYVFFDLFFFLMVRGLDLYHMSTICFRQLDCGSSANWI